MSTYVRNGAYALTLALAASLSLTATANADAGQGAFRLGTDVRVLGLLHYPDALDPSIQFGFVGTDIFLDSRPQLIVHGAYQATDALLIGARLGLAYQGLDSGAETIDAGAFGILPFFEYLFGDGNIRPFVGAEVGFQLAFVEGFGFFGAGDLNTHAMFIAGGLGGVHIFLADGFSISPGAVFDFLYYGRNERAGYQLTFMLSFEGWIGGGGSRGQAARTTTAETLP
jgi:hypothetical protein